MNRGSIFDGAKIIPHPQEDDLAFKKEQHKLTGKA
jgi:hypothetical protein